MSNDPGPPTSSPPTPTNRAPSIVWPDASELMLSVVPQLGMDEQAMFGRYAVHRQPLTGPREWLDRIATASVVILSGELPAGILTELAGSLRHVVFLGTDPATYVDLDEAAATGTRVHAIRGYGDATVAEHAIALILAGLHDVVGLDRGTRTGRWPRAVLRTMPEVVVGVVGYGGIGRLVAQRALVLGARVLVSNRTPRSPNTPFGTVEFVGLDKLLTVSDVVTLHLPLTPQTRGVLDERRIALLKHDAIMVNTARSALIDNAALVRRLESGTLACAALDVFDEEPVDPASPLLASNRTILSPHVAFASRAAMVELLGRAIRLADGVEDRDDADGGDR